MSTFGFRMHSLYVPAGRIVTCIVSAPPQAAAASVSPGAGGTRGGGGLPAYSQMPRQSRPSVAMCRCPPSQHTIDGSCSSVGYITQPPHQSSGRRPSETTDRQTRGSRGGWGGRWWLVAAAHLAGRGVVVAHQALPIHHPSQPTHPSQPSSQAAAAESESVSQSVSEQLGRQA